MTNPDNVGGLPKPMGFQESYRAWNNADGKNGCLPSFMDRVEALLAARDKQWAELCRAAPAGGDSLRLLVKELRESLEGVVRVADRNTDEFDRAREAIARAARVFVNAGDSEAQFIADSRDLNCPACGGSGHVDDSAPAGSGEVADDVMKIADFFEGVRVFVTSREKIKHPEGTDLFDWHVKRLRRTAALLRKLQQGAG